MKRLQLILFYSLSVLLLFAQSPKREMRATWLATVWQIDWPGNVISTTGNATEMNAQKNAMIRILDSISSANMNAVCFQVRSRCDAMYQSSYEPWSTDLVATRGMNPGYDPLAFVIQEGHKRGIEVHAWLNPYRFETSANQWSGKAGDYRATNPSWLLTYSNGISILDPGNPAVVKRIKDIVAEIVQNYDVDGILFDDYFYAYGGTPSTLDENTQALYKPADMNLGDWRRANVNSMVKAVYDTIQNIKPYVRFGVSPFGIWTTDQAAATKEGIKLPDGITGGDMYNSIYCDPISWLKQGSVDYISPQLYWGTGGAQDYGVLSPWWSALSNQFGKHFYSSQDLAGLSTSSYAPALRIPKRKSIYRINGNKLNINALSQIERKQNESKPKRVSAGDFTQEEIGKQITINRNADENGAPGSIFFSTKQLYLTHGFINYLKKFHFTHKSIAPAVNWKSFSEYQMVTDISLNGFLLSWNSNATNVRYTIYAIPNDKLIESGNFSTSTYVAGISYTKSFTIPKNTSDATHTFAVAVLDRFGNEFPPQVMGQPQGIPVITNLLSPANNKSVIMPFAFNWTTDAAAELYLLEVAEDAGFTKPVCSRELTTGTFLTNQLDVLQNGKTYYWRVKTRKANTNDGISEVRTFVPQAFNILQPQSGSTEVSLTPTISWLDVNSESSYLVEISKNNQFSPNSIIYSEIGETNNLLIPQSVLTGLTNYYVRVSVNINGVNVVSNVVSFKTKEVVPEVPIFVLPAMNSSIFGSEIRVKWSEGIASSYRVELSQIANFPARSTKISSVEAYIYETVFSGLAPAEYYLRVRAEYSVGLSTSWSDTLKVILQNNTAVPELKAGDISCHILYSDKEAVLRLTSLQVSLASVSIISMSGVNVQEILTNHSLYAGTNYFALPVNEMKKGVYLISVKTEQGQCVLKYVSR